MTAKTRPHEPRRIALVKPSALGDIVNSLPVLTALRKRFPDAHISWIVNRAFAPLLQGHPDLDETIPFDRHLTWLRPISGMSAMVRFVRELRRRRFDLVIDLQGLFRTGLIAYLSGAKRRVGLASAREGAPGFTRRWWTTPTARPMPLIAAGGWRSISERAGEKRFHLPVEPPPANGPGSCWPSIRALACRRRRLALAHQTLAAGAFRRAGAPGHSAIWRQRHSHRRIPTKRSWPGIRLSLLDTARFSIVAGTTSLPQLDGAACAGGRAAGQRHGAVAPGGCSGPACGGTLYLHQGQPQWALWSVSQRHRNAGSLSREVICVSAIDWSAWPS